MLSSLSSRLSTALVFSTAPPHMTICPPALWVRFDLLTKAESQLRKVPKQIPSCGHCLSPTHRWHRKKQCQTWSRILQHQWFCYWLCWFLPWCFSVFCRHSQQSYISPLGSAFWALRQAAIAGRLVTSDTNQRTRGKVQWGSLCQHLRREDNHFPPPQRPFLPRILPKSQWQQTETKVKEFHLLQLGPKETPVIIVRRWLCIPSHSSIPPATSLSSVPEFMWTCGRGFSPRPPWGSSNSNSLLRFHNIYLPGIKVNRAHHAEA